MVTSFTATAAIYGLPTSTLTDNGTVYTARFTNGHNDFERVLATLGITQKNGRPGHPQTQGKIERFHQTLKRWLRPRPRPSIMSDMQQLLDQFTAIYNTQRTHRALPRPPHQRRPTTPAPQSQPHRTLPSPPRHHRPIRQTRPALRQPHPPPRHRQDQRPHPSSHPGHHNHRHRHQQNDLPPHLQPHHRPRPQLLAHQQKHPGRWPGRFVTDDATQV